MDDDLKEKPEHSSQMGYIIHDNYEQSINCNLAEEQGSNS